MRIGGGFLAVVIIIILLIWLFQKHFVTNQVGPDTESKEIADQPGMIGQVPFSFGDIYSAYYAEMLRMLDKW